MIYLSIPYTGKEYVSFRVSCAVAAELAKAGNVVVAPIIYGHVLSDHGHAFDHDHDWLKHDLEILHHCNQVVVVKLKGWEESVGVQAEMAEAKMAEIVAEISRQWPGTRVAIWHRVGRLAPGEASVVIAAAAPHREEAFAAARYAIERLKRVVPIWKKEVWEDGQAWIGSQLDPYGQMGRPAGE